MPDLTALLPVLLPKAIAWAESQERLAVASGKPLDAHDLELARRVGVQHAERIRVVIAIDLPWPDDLQLTQVAIQSGLLGPMMIGLTFGYAVFLRRGHEANLRLRSHEFRHVHQYESFGSINNFLSVYLKQIAEEGYNASPFEADARAHEVSV